MTRLGQTSVDLPPIGLGTGSFSDQPAQPGEWGGVLEADAIAMVHYALDHGLTLIDTAPWYGDKAAERILGKALEGRKRSSYVLATKICLEFEGANARHYYGRDDVLRGLEGSLKRLKHREVDIIHIHDPIDAAYDQIVRETFPTVLKLKEQGVCKAISVGTGNPQIAMRLSRDLPLDAVMLAGRYSLLEQTAISGLEELRGRGIPAISAGIYNSGILATGTKGSSPKYNYQNAPSDVIARVRRLEAVCERHGVRLKAAAAQFVQANPAIISIVLGADSVEQIRETISVFKEPISAAFWEDLRAESLIDPRSPLPPPTG